RPGIGAQHLPAALRARRDPASAYPCSRRAHFHASGRVLDRRLAPPSGRFPILESWHPARGNSIGNRLPGDGSHLTPAGAPHYTAGSANRGKGRTTADALQIV